jgi:hypothetical protein
LIETEREVNANNVGVSLLAMRIFQSIHSNQTDRYREQAHSYRDRIPNQEVSLLGKGQ